MERAAFPDNEAARLAALQEYEILDTLPEPAYDDISRVAAQICGTPIALITLIDENRQWCKARVGLDLQETPRDEAFCAHAILEPDALLVVEDTLQDPRFADDPRVTGDPGIRFYAGAPLVTADGHALGSLCVIDRQPRKLDAAQRESLQALARQVVAQLELRRALRTIERDSQTLAAANAELERRNVQMIRSRDELASMCRLLEDHASSMERDLNRAEIIQRSLLPHEVPKLKDVCLHSLYRPGHNIGGDLFDVVVVDERYLVLVMADAAGHGVSAALISMLFKHRLQVTGEHGRPYRPCEALSRLNDAMQIDKPAPGVFVTATYCLFDMEQRSLLAASAGHPPLIWLSAAGETRLLAHTGPALGLYAGAQYGEHSVKLGHGDRLLLYTDGLFGSVSGPAAFTPETIAEALRAVTADGNLLAKLLANLTGGAAVEDQDDVSMILLEAAAGESHLDEPVDLASPRAAGQQESAQLSYAEADDVTFLALEGRVSWLCGQALLEAALLVIDSGRPLIIDLQRCDYLDSTMLGTLHELVQRAAARGSRLSIQNVGPSLEEAFRELSMGVVLERMVGDALPVPEQRRQVRLPQHSSGVHQERLLRAHQVLAELSEENRKEFNPVIEALRSS
ncbi:MAG: SpoIIE family protein phosphatase [Pseudomonadales bacterium]